MICWAYLLYRTARVRLARRAHRHSELRIDALLQLRRTIDSELLQALRAEGAAAAHLNTVKGGLS